MLTLHLAIHNVMWNNFDLNCSVTVCKIIRILHGCEMQIENSVPRVTVWHHEALPSAVWHHEALPSDAKQ